jgi:signal transduction histidine kinase
MLIVLATLLVLNVTMLRYFTHSYYRGKEMNLLTYANVLGVLGRDFLDHEDEQAKETIEDTARSIASRVIITDGSGRVREDSAGNTALLGTILNQTEVKTALTGRSAVAVTALRGNSRVMVVAVPIMLDKQVVGTVLISSPMADVESILQGIRLRMAAGSLISLCGALLVSMMLTVRITRPVAELSHGVRAVADGVLTSRVTVQGDDELAELARAFNLMAEKLGQTEIRRRRFVADASHELQTPLSAVRILAETITKSLETDPDAAREFMQDLISETDRMSELVRDLLELARLDGAPEGLNIEDLDLKELVADTIHRLQPAAERKAVGIELTGVSIQVPGDRSKLQRLLLNLLDNAVKFAPPGSRVRVHLRREGEQGVFTMTDSGPGMDETELQRIFDRFYRVDSARTRQDGGTGLGLAIAKQIVLAHGGTIRADSSLGAGTVITVRIPAGKDNGRG